MTTTMALAAISSVGPEMTSLDIMPVTRMATKPAWKAGWVLSVTKVGMHATGWTVVWGARFSPLTAVRWQSGILPLSLS